MKTCIIGASGYSGQVLVELLIQHPKVNLVTVTSRQNEGKKVGEVIPKIAHRAQNLTFTNPTIKELVSSECEVFFSRPPPWNRCHIRCTIGGSRKKGYRLICRFQTE